ncbi:MAG: YSC84-related protein [Acetobacteraceae bacterium]
MQQTRRSLLAASGLAAAGFIGVAGVPSTALADPSAREINRDVDRVLRDLYATHAKSRELGKRAVAILVFPKIIKAGFLLGGQGGYGALREQGKSVGYYSIAAASFGLQAGVQSFSYALFFMTPAALKYLKESDGWAIGSGPSVVVLDKGAAASVTSTTLTQDVYAIPFGQRGLMAGLSLEGSKITHATVTT